MERKDLIKRLKANKLDDVLREIMVDAEGNTLNQGQFAADLEIDDDTASKGFKFIKALCEKRPVCLELHDVLKECADMIKELTATIDGQAKHLRNN